MEHELVEIEQVFLWAQDPLRECAGAKVIVASEFADLAADLAQFPMVKLSEQAIYTLFLEETKRFTACGANHGLADGVLRKNQDTGWKYLIDKITK